MLIILIIVLIGFQVKDIFFNKDARKRPPPPMYEQYGEPRYEHFMPDDGQRFTQSYTRQPKVQIQEVTSLNTLFPEVPQQTNYTYDEMRVGQNYTKQPRSTQLQNISSINNPVTTTQTSYDYIPYEPNTRFQTPIYYVIQDRPNISNFIRA